MRTLIRENSLVFAYPTLRLLTCEAEPQYGGLAGPVHQYAGLTLLNEEILMGSTCYSRLPLNL
jgi:hypothetical protein